MSKYDVQHLECKCPKCEVHHVKRTKNVCTQLMKKEEDRFILVCPKCSWSNLYG